MKNAEPRTLEAMQSRATCYEVVVSVNGKDFIAGYMSRKTKSTLVAVAQFYSEYLLNALGADADKPVSYNRDGLVFSPTVRVYFTGRTERDARIGMGG